MALKLRARQVLLLDWTEHHPILPYYPYLLSLEPHAFMGLDKFITGRIHPMRACKSNLAAHLCWLSDDSDSTSLKCHSRMKNFDTAHPPMPSQGIGQEWPTEDRLLPRSALPRLDRPITPGHPLRIHLPQPNRASPQDANFPVSSPPDLLPSHPTNNDDQVTDLFGSVVQSCLNVCPL